MFSTKKLKNTFILLVGANKVYDSNVCTVPVCCCYSACCIALQQQCARKYRAETFVSCKCNSDLGKISVRRICSESMTFDLVD
jgi:hypothetical protein